MGLNKKTTTIPASKLIELTRNVLNYQTCKRPMAKTLILHPGARDITGETLLQAKQVAAQNGMPSKRAVSFWMTKGIRGQMGNIVFLESVKVGRTRLTSQEALNRFIRKLNSIDEVEG